MVERFSKETRASQYGHGILCLTANGETTKNNIEWTNTQQLLSDAEIEQHSTINWRHCWMNTLQFTPFKPMPNPSNHIPSWGGQDYLGNYTIET